jgi:hypothetical protein
MAVCCQNLTVGSLSSRSALSLLVGALFKQFGLVLNTPCILSQHSNVCVARNLYLTFPAAYDFELL